MVLGVGFILQLVVGFTSTLGAGMIGDFTDMVHSNAAYSSSGSSCLCLDIRLQRACGHPIHLLMSRAG